MFQSRQLEKPHTKTRFSRQAEEIIEKQKKKKNQKEKEQKRHGFDMWEDEPNGC